MKKQASQPSFAKGQTVSFELSGSQMNGKVIRVNRLTLTVEVSEFDTFRVPYALVRPPVPASKSTPPPKPTLDAPVLKAGVLYWGDNGRVVCARVRCCGGSALYSGYSLDGHKTVRVSKKDLAEMAKTAVEEKLPGLGNCECGALRASDILEPKTAPKFRIGDAVESAPDSSDRTAMGDVWIATIAEVKRDVDGAPDRCAYVTHGRWASDRQDKKPTERQLWAGDLAPSTAEARADEIRSSASDAIADGSVSPELADDFLASTEDFIRQERQEGGSK